MRDPDCFIKTGKKESHFEYKSSNTKLTSRLSQNQVSSNEWLLVPQLDRNLGQGEDYILAKRLVKLSYITVKLSYITVSYIEHKFHFSPVFDESQTGFN